MDGSLFYHRGLAYYSKGSLGAYVFHSYSLMGFVAILAKQSQNRSLLNRNAHCLTFAGDAATDLEAALTKALDETLMPSCFYNLGLCKASRCCCC
jgi:hypothetical protein